MPFNNPYVITDDLGPVVGEFLTDSEPGAMSWPDLETANDDAEEPPTAPEAAPLRVWATHVGAGPG
ncbi:hypothetical protein ACFYVL_08645 [Streptomyces sp. NPDC004111]|uniref:hypothetical protein n=1 Tax=Streptomyces sp. NPDC004111 TaxID=3364690 RepID=UPI0036BD6D79